MEKELRNSYCISFPIILLILYFLLKSEGGMAMGVLIVFIVTSIPFLLINVGQYFYNLKKTTKIISIIYIIIITVLSIFQLDKEDSIILSLIYFVILFVIILELINNKTYLILNFLGLIYSISFLIYVVWDNALKILL